MPLPRVNKILYLLAVSAATFLHSQTGLSQTAMVNIYGRNITSLNGDWNVVIDPSNSGDWRQVWAGKKPERKTDFIEYSFEGGPVLHIPGDFNSQIKELTFMEGTVWYKKTFVCNRKNNKRLFVHFGAVNYTASVYLNGKLLGSHEGGFTPFQFELTSGVQEGENSIVVKTNSQRREDGIPGPGYDWFNYGGITRDVNLVETNSSFIEDYFIQLKKQSANTVQGWIKLNGNTAGETVEVRIPELNIRYNTTANSAGEAAVNFTGKFQLWSPEQPRLYKVIVQSATDTVTDEIGFRTIETKNNRLLLNGKPVFFKGINIHEESPMKAARAYSESDALVLLTWAKELGCNLVRLAHYPHSEHMVKLAEKMGLMVWDEIPVYQHILFSNPAVPAKMDLMMKEMVRRDRNRCAVMFWSISNETYTSSSNRTNALIELAGNTRLQDDTRLITAPLSNQGYQNNTFNVWDTLVNYLDVISINEYAGWYAPWQGNPADTKWKFVTEKPLIISEFGGEAKFGANDGPPDEAASWSEAYQAQIYRDQITMFSNCPNLVGLCPWLLVDYRSPGRMHPVYQNGYNRKGLLSEFGEKKKAWYVLQEYYNKMKPLN